MDLLHRLLQLFVPQMSEQTPGHEPLSLSSLRQSVVSEAFKGVAELSPVKHWRGPLLLEVMRVRVLRGWIDPVYEFGFVLIGSHVSLVVVVLVLGAVEVTGEGLTPGVCQVLNSSNTCEHHFLLL